MPLSEEQLAAYLAGRAPSHSEEVMWPWQEDFLPLRIAVYLTQELPPEPLVTSVRAVVLRGDEVMTVLDADGFYHVVPGGRREAGEGLKETARREVLEETGWRATIGPLLAVAHFHHLGPKPPGYPHPYPDFLQLVYRARARAHAPEEQEEAPVWEVEARFRPVAEARELVVGSQRLLLEAAL
ncbi:MAG: NUDIX domain-containing protein [Candidatus Promineifilaceae bacterium]|nr:NUDIX domain-containing protein [Candidatus Promineifilaceae bacterium]